MPLCTRNLENLKKAGNIAKGISEDHILLELSVFLLSKLVILSTALQELEA